MAGISIDAIKNALPDDLKSKGAVKLGQIALSQILTFEGKALTPLTNLKDKFISGTCPPKEELQSILEQRNNIVNDLNNVGSFLDKTTVALTGFKTLFDLFLTIKSSLKTAEGTINTAKIAINQALKATPVAPGAIVSALTDLGDAANALGNKADDITFDNLGESKLTPLQNGLNAATIYVALSSTTLKGIITILNAIDAPLQKCLSSANMPGELISLSKELDTLSQLQDAVGQTENQTTYQGFVLEIETVSYNSTINQRRAIAKNSQGIVMVQTPLSFSTNAQTLINELKVIIDKNNLKA
jgi:phosphopantetheine adenylyltransferase